MSIILVIKNINKRHYDIEDYNSNIQLKNDGSIGVSTRVQYNIHGKYDLLVIPQALPKDVDTINNVEVYEIKNNKQVLLKKGTNADISKEAKMNARKICGFFSGKSNVISILLNLCPQLLSIFQFNSEILLLP